VPTVSEILRRVPTGFVVVGGRAGLGREVTRIVLLRTTDLAAASVGPGDLLVYTATGGRYADDNRSDHALVPLLMSGAAGVLTDAQPMPDEAHTAERFGAPLLVSIGAIQPEQLCTQLEHALATDRVQLETRRAAVQRTMSYLARAGATAEMLLDRLVEITGKAAFLNPATGHERLQLAVLQDLDGERVRRGLEINARQIQRWLAGLEVGVAAALNVELAAERLVRLVAPVWVDGVRLADVSLFARPDELAAFDRAALLAASAALSTAYAFPPLELSTNLRTRRSAAVALCAAEANPEDLANAVRREFATARVMTISGPDDVPMCVTLDCGVRADLTTRLADWQAQVFDDIGPISIGHAVRMGVDESAIRCAMAQATEAAVIGDRLFGPGHVTSYADAHLADFLLKDRDPSDLQSLFEKAVAKLSPDDASKRDRELVRTLEVYCEEASTQRTAERLQIHRNTVLYRLRHIAEVTSYDLDDAATRLLLRLGLLAGRLVQQTTSVVTPPATRLQRRRKADYTLCA
jgi:PucR C-terminal helix-turn-helix domain